MSAAPPCLCSREMVPTDLTSRQRQVLKLVAEGRPMKEAAHILNVTYRTIAFHKYRMMQRLGLKSTAELVRFAVRHGLVS